MDKDSGKDIGKGIGKGSNLPPELKLKPRSEHESENILDGESAVARISTQQRRK